MEPSKNTWSVENHHHVLRDPDGKVLVKRKTATQMKKERKLKRAKGVKN